LLHCCYTVVTLLLHSCCTGVTLSLLLSGRGGSGHRDALKSQALLKDHHIRHWV
jgi:hypothetical protein